MRSHKDDLLKINKNKWATASVGGEVCLRIIWDCSADSKTVDKYDAIRLTTYTADTHSGLNHRKKALYKNNYEQIITKKGIPSH